MHQAFKYIRWIFFFYIFTYWVLVQKQGIEKKSQIERWDEKSSKIWVKNMYLHLNKKKMKLFYTCRFKLSMTLFVVCSVWKDTMERWDRYWLDWSYMIRVMVNRGRSCQVFVVYLSIVRCICGRTYEEKKHITPLKGLFKRLFSLR